MIVDAAEHRNIADRLAAIGADGDSTPTGQMLLDRAAFDAAQQDLGVRGAADQQRRRGVLGARMMAHARIAEIAIGEAQRAQEEYLEKPVENDRDPAEKNVPWTLGATKI